MIDFDLVRQECFLAQDSVFNQTDKIHVAITLITASLKAGGKVLWCGNGGSAAESQHMSAELMVRFVKNRIPLASIALCTDTSLLTAHSNDFEFETVFARQVEALGKASDVLIAISTSGHSANVVKAIEQAKFQNLSVIGLFGKNSTGVESLCDIAFFVDSDKTARIQEGHTLINHLICEGLDELFV